MSKNESEFIYFVITNNIIYKKNEKFELVEYKNKDLDSTNKDKKKLNLVLVNSFLNQTDLDIYIYNTYIPQYEKLGFKFFESISIDGKNCIENSSRAPRNII